MAVNSWYIMGVKPWYIIACKVTLWEQAAGQRYVHLAAHGSFNPVAPQFSRLYLAPGGAEALPAERRDGFLEAREVWNLPLESAQLVALSACQTQVGDLSAGDEWAGLSRAFIYAGTSGLVASLWNVEDASTAHLMTAFYARVEAGEDPAVGLRAAQLALLNDSQYAHPYHWAAFNYTGAPPSITISDPPEPPNTSGGGLCASAAFPLALLALAWVWRQR